MGGMKNRKQIEEIADARLRLLEASVHLFAEQGVTGTTVAEIARLAGVTSAMVHYYFKTKDQLLDAIVEEKLIDGFFAFLATDLALQQAAATTLAETLVWRIIEASDQMPWLPSLWVREVLSEGGMLRKKLITHPKFGRQLNFREFFAGAQRRGEISQQVNPQLLFMSIMGLTLLPLSMAKSWERIPVIGKASKQELGNHVVALLQNGLSVAHNAK